VAYQVFWNRVADATAYRVEEATDDRFSAASSRNVPADAMDAVFVQTTAADLRVYYRVTALNRSGDCAVDAPPSNIVSTVVRAGISSSPSLRAVIPVAGLVRGNFGSLFRTTLQMHNSTDGPLSGAIVFHAAGASGSASDPSVLYSLEPAETAEVDLAPLFASGAIGSLDVNANGALPDVAARIYNDAGEAGTSGMNIEMVNIDQAMTAGDRAVLIAPADASLARMNIGVRSLESGAMVRFELRSAAGEELRSVELPYAPVFFIQRAASDVLGANIPSGSSITVSVVAGSAIVYGSITDNTTQDPAVQLLRRRSNPRPPA
jgi:hypothetical protein